MQTYPKLEQIQLVEVETIDDRSLMEHGKLYVSRRYRCAIHLCACGCGIETVTPLNAETGWTLTVDGTLHPSVGNNQLPCRSHYWITEGRIVWLPPFPK